MNDQDVLARVTASQGRRVMGVGALGLLGLLCIWIGFATNPAAIWQAFVVFLGVFALVMAVRMWRATASSIELTETELRDSDGTRIALVSEIIAMDRGMFAFKPSNGFLLKLSVSHERSWRPGLWWRIGRRVGVGGMTPGSQTKMMAEIIAAMLARREY